MTKKPLRIYLFDKVPFDILSRDLFLDKLVGLMTTGRKCKVLNMNTYGVVSYLENNRYADIMDSATIIYPDGWGPVLASKYLKDNLKERINVGDFIDELIFRMDKKKLRLYLLGSEDWLVRSTVGIIKNKYKKIIISGYHDGFFKKRDEQKIAAEIKRSKPNLVLIGMGLPVQEYFMSNNWKNLPNSVYMGVGGVFNYIVKTKSRAPSWMRDYGLEWLYRLIQEPYRLGYRYTITNIKFFMYILKYTFFKI